MTNSKVLPRGYRDNNPLNLRPSQPWEGITGVDTSGGEPGYLQFVDAQHGIRAGVRILLRYEENYGLHTIRQIMNRWAPSSDDNPTQRYITFVAIQLGISPDQVMSITETTAPTFIEALIRFELGDPLQYGRAEWYSKDLVVEGVHMAFHSTPPAPLVG